MNKFTKLTGILAVAAIALLCAAPAQAQATRTWVSGVGDDANPCSRTAPCKTFAGAISKTAAGGEIDVLDPGGFGALTITKAITIDGSGGSIAGILVTGTPGFSVIAGAGDIVTVRNLDFEGVGTGTYGIRFTTGAALHVEHCVIRDFRATGGAGINFTPSGNANLYVDDTIVSSNGSGTGSSAVGGGVVIMPTGGASAVASLDNVRIEGNSNGIKVDTTGGGGISSAVLFNSFVSGGSVGVAAVTSGTQAIMQIANTVVQNFSIYGIAALGVNAQTVFGSSVITKNGTGIFSSGGNTISFGDNDVAGNGTNGAPTVTAPKI